MAYRFEGFFARPHVRRPESLPHGVEWRTMDIDFVYGLGCCKGVPFGPETESEYEKVEGAYIRLMAKFGLSAEVALRFDPFARGFWDADQ